MRDPFPLPPVGWLADAVSPLATRWALYTLPLHIHEVLLFALLYTAVQLWLSPRLSSRLFPVHYGRLSARGRLNWDVHVVSLVQSVLVCGLALAVMRADVARKSMDEIRGDGLFERLFGAKGFEDRVWGYTGALGLVQAAGCGYFLWDFVVSAVNVDMFGVGMLAHAASALTVFSFGFRPFVNYYAPTFILYELSSPFLNIHWFCDKLDATGGTVQLLNGFVLLGSFFGCRLVWGSWQSMRVFVDVIRAARVGGFSFDMRPAAGMHNVSVPALGSPGLAREDVRLFANPGGAVPHAVPIWLAAAYLGANVVLNGLNWFWFGKMIATIRKRFPPPLGTKGVQRPHHKGKRELKEPVSAETTGRATYKDGLQHVELESTEVRRVNAHANTGADGPEAKEKSWKLSVPERREEGSSEDETMVP